MIVVLALAFAPVFLALVVAARRVGHPTASFALSLVAGIVALPLLLLGLASIAHVRNDARLARFAAQLDRFPPPPGAHVVHRLRDVGLITGNGDHCDFLARHEIASTQPIERVRAHYARLRLRPAAAGGADGGLPLLFVEPRTGGGYVVTALDAPYGPGLDDRCH